MFAAERALDRAGERAFLKIARQHAGPGDGLENEPMRSGRRKHGDDQKCMT